MAYQEIAVSSVAGVAAAIRTFAGSLGWQVSATSITRPMEEGQVGFSKVLKITGDEFEGSGADPLNTNGTTSTKSILVEDEGNPLSFMRCYLPMMTSGQRQPNIPNPTKVYCFGEGLPRPWLSFVLEFGFNQYRPIYIGGIDRVGVYGPGDVIATAVGIMDSDDQGWPKTERQWQGMFSAGMQADHLNSSSVGDPATGIAGGLIVGDALHKFYRQSVNAAPTVDSSTGANLPVVFGGPKDGPMETLISHGQSPFSGDNILSVVNLFTIRGGTGVRRAHPLGSIRGVRAVNMKNLEPGARIVVGNQAWRVFPQISKNFDTSIPLGPRGASQTGTRYSGYCLRESSGMYGFAHLEGTA